jgi:cell division protein ZapA
VNSLHRVKVLGREVRVRSTSSTDQVREVETFVNDTIFELQESMKTTDPQLIAILALLNLGESLLLQSRESCRKERLVRERVTYLISRIDETVKYK